MSQHSASAIAPTHGWLIHDYTVTLEHCDCPDLPTDGCRANTSTRLPWLSISVFPSHTLSLTLQEMKRWSLYSNSTNRSGLGVIRLTTKQPIMKRLLVNLALAPAMFALSSCNKADPNGRD